MRPSHACLLLALTLFGCNSPNTGSDSGPPATDSGSSADSGPSTDSGAADSGGELPTGCNPLASEHDCMLPFPSDVFRTNGRVQIPDGARPLLPEDNTRYDLISQYPLDGFSASAAILALFRAPIDDAPLVGPYEDAAASITTASPTLLLDTVTNEFVPHFAELDARTTDDTKRTLLIRPLVRLQDGRRYVVAIHGLSLKNGAGPLPTPAGFRALRDAQAASTPLVAPLAAHFDTGVFAPLTAKGLNRAELQLAWDFTTATEQSALGDMLWIRQDVIQYFTDNPPVVTVSASEDNPRMGRTDTSDTYRIPDTIARHINATVRLPLYLESGTELGARLHRDSMGRVARNGTYEAKFVVVIPNSVSRLTDTDPRARIVQFGHGAFGGREECEASWSYTPGYFDAHTMVGICTNWMGMEEADRQWIIEQIAVAPDHIMDFTDRVHQAMANQIAVEYVARRHLAGMPEMRFGTNMPVVANPGELYYYGISQGATIGGAFLAMSPTIDRGVLQVGGGPYSLLMMRSSSFGIFLQALDGRFARDPILLQKFVMMSQYSFDRVEAATYLHRARTNTLPGSPASRKILAEVGLSDALVPNLGALISAREMGLPLLDPLPYTSTPYGLQRATAPAESAMVVYDFMVDPPLGILPIPPTSADEDRSPTHEGIRRSMSSMARIDAFLRPNGMVTQPCTGTCNPE